MLYLQTGCSGKPVEIIKIADATEWIPCMQPLVEARIAFARRVTAIVVGSVETEKTIPAEQLANTREERNNLFPAHDVDRVRGEDRICFKIRPWPATDIERDRSRDVRQRGLIEPGPDTGMILGQVARMPGEMRHHRCKMDSMLAGTAANLEHAAPAPEKRFDDGEDGIPVLITGL